MFETLKKDTYQNKTKIQNGEIMFEALYRSYLSLKLRVEGIRSKGRIDVDIIKRISTISVPTIRNTRSSFTPDTCYTYFQQLITRTQRFEFNLIFTLFYHVRSLHKISDT